MASDSTYLSFALVPSGLCLAVGRVRAVGQIDSVLILQPAESKRGEGREEGRVEGGGRSRGRCCRAETEEEAN